MQRKPKVRADCMSSKTDFGQPQAVYQALHHPFRRELLQFMYESGEPKSAVDFVRERGVDGKSEDAAISYVSYHLRALQKAHAIDLAATEAVRGTAKYLYGINESFASAYRDTLALNRIASLLDSNPEAGADILAEIGEIVTSTGRSDEG
jgi:hypothetical protein